jgi:hypothetical protein
MNSNFNNDFTQDDSRNNEILVVTGRGTDREQLESVFGNSEIHTSFCSPAELETVMDDTSPDLVLLCIEETSMEVVGGCLTTLGRTPTIVAGRGIEVDSLVDLFRSGVDDYIDLCSVDDVILDRVQNAFDDIFAPEASGVIGKFDDLRKEVDDASHDMPERLDIVSSVSAYRALVSQDLDIEGVLQTSLEFLLSKTGPTNAAVLLAESEVDYALGAYVNFECPRELADPVLDRLANGICHHVAEQGELVKFHDVKEFIEAVGPEAEILQNSDVIAMPCTHEGECLAVVFLFRDVETPFTEEMAPLLDSLRQVFGEQLAKVVRIHHRLDAQWPDSVMDEAEDFTDWGFGSGDSKAA